MKKKVLISFLMIAIITVLFAISINAAEPVKSWNISASGSSVTARLYSDTENSGYYTLTISGTGDMKKWAYSSFAPWYSSYNKKIKKVVIEEGVTNVSDYAFWCCSSLESVTLPFGITSIGNSSFYECTALKEIGLPNSLVSIGGSAFRGSGLTYFIAPDSVTTIGQYALYESNISFTLLGSGVEKIGDYAFTHVSSSIYSKAPSKPSGWSTYWNNANYNGVIWGIDGGILENGLIWLYKSNELSIKKSTRNESEIIIPSNIEGYAVTTIASGAFAGCDALTSIVIPDGITSIEFDAFYECTALESAIIPDSVLYMGTNVFCTNPLLTIYCESKSQPEGWSVLPYSSWNYHNRPVVWDYKNTMQGGIFTFKGYSFSGNGGFAVGFEIDYEAKARYEVLTGKTLEIGVVFAGYDNLGGSLPLDENGEAIALEIGRVIKADVTEYGYKYYDFMLTGFNDDIRDVLLVVAGYIFEGETVKYVQENGISETVFGISYNEASK